ncbi:DUF2061 domain-containing protein [Massilia sp. PAMC28688]|uniref:DUF2061 domain-containing protein n=1 Tax=Massilia sp. PAMC28688 TaxID=2861283 RepID=UPI001C62B3F9|nr:DUF2061 domain-containing protein [Massilia sp. PAMC28688]QYF91866.1 DUF2061 domain-containing protein [Massilia sp. PAMC28688]
MLTAAKTASQIATHTLIAFGLMYGMTGSAAFGGVAALVEPVINVLLLPRHARFWQARRQRIRRIALAIAAEKVSQTLMHMGVAFLTGFGLTGSLAFGGAMALIEPVCNVIILPLHDGLWERMRLRWARALWLPA